MKQSKIFTVLAWLLCFQLSLAAFSGIGSAASVSSQLYLSESFQRFEGNVPDGFTVFNKDGGNVTFEMTDNTQKKAAKYSIHNLPKNVNFQYGFTAPVSGQLIFETKIRAEDANLYFPIFQISDSRRVSATLASLSGGKIRVGADNKVLSEYIPGIWYHLHFAIDTETGKADVYLNGERKLDNIFFWAKGKTPGTFKEVREVSTFKSYLKGQVGKTLTVYQDDIRVYSGNSPILDESYFEQKTPSPEEDNPSIPQDDLPAYYENPDAGKIIADLTAHNPANEHPRLFFRRDSLAALKQKVQTDPLAKKWYEDLIKDGNKLLKEPVGKYELPDGRRMPAAKNARPRIEMTALLYLLSGESKYFDRAVKEMKAMIAFPDWNHQNEFLNTAEMAAGIAIGYDWLYHDLSEELRAEIRQALIDKGLNKAKEAYSSNVWWSLKRALVNNWNAVCNGGIGMAALAIGDEAPEIAGHVLEKAIPSLERGILTEFVPDGAWGEGPGYWRYTIEYVVSFLASLESASGTMYGMEKTPGLKETAYFPIYLTGPNGSFNYADATSNKMKIPELLWLAGQLNDPAIATARLRLMEEARQKGGVYDLIWYDPSLKGELNLDLDKYFRQVEVLTMRSQWNNPYAQFVGFKGGQGYTSHGHLDIGNFVYQANGETWAEDLGSDNYASGYFNYHDQRFHFYRAKPEGHNTLVINPDGQYQQDIMAQNPIIRMDSKPKGALAILDMTGAYNKNVTSAKRGLLFTHNREQLVVQDEIQLKQPSDVYWFMHTLADITIEDSGQSALLAKNGQKLRIEIISPNKSDLRFQVEPAKALPGEPLPAGQKDNRNYKRLFIKGNPQSEYILAVALIPLKYGEDKPASLPEFRLMNDWTIADGDIRRPKLDMIYLNGKPLDSFVPDQYYYTAALPFGTNTLPVVTTDSNYEVQIKPAKNWLDETVITVKDPNTEDETVTYVLRFHILPGKEMPRDSHKLTVTEATASTYQNEPAKKQVNPPQNAIDGLPATRWAAEGNQWIRLELTRPELVRHVAIAFARGNARIFQFEIEASMDGDTWTPLYKGANSGNSQELEYFSVEPIFAQYIRIHGHGNSQNKWNTYTEIELWGDSVADAASRSALEVLIASGSALQLTPDYQHSGKDQRDALDSALREAQTGLQNPLLPAGECQHLIDKLTAAIRQIKDSSGHTSPTPNNPDTPKPEDPSAPPISYIPPQADDRTSSVSVVPKQSSEPSKNGEDKLSDQGKAWMQKTGKKLVNIPKKDTAALSEVLSNAPLSQRATAYFRLTESTTRQLKNLISTQYRDVTADSWYTHELSAVTMLGLLNGYPDGSFGGQKPISGQEMIAFLMRLRGNTQETADSKWFDSYLEKAKESGWIDDVFSSEKILTREETAYYLARYLGETKIAMKEVDDLVSVNPKYREAVNLVYSSGIMQGYPKGTFHPQATISRSEVITILYRLLQMLK